MSSLISLSIPLRGERALWAVERGDEGQETQVHGDAGFTGVEKRVEIVALGRPIDWQIACKRGLIKALAEGAEKEACKAVEQAKASVRAFAEHPFHILKNLFGYRKVRYRGLANVVMGTRVRAAT